MITATDHLQRPRRQGRSIRFGATDVVQQSKSPLILAELGRDQVGTARRQIRELEAGLSGSSPPDPARLERLARAGKVGELMGRVLGLHSRLGFDGGLVQFGYRLKNHGWRIDDPINGEVLPGDRSGRRSIRFLAQDLTRQAPGPRHGMDLIVCTNVLPYLKLYGGSNEKLGAGLRQIARSLRRGGALMIDGWSTDYLIKQDHPAFLRAMERSDRRVLVATPRQLAPLRSNAPRP